MSPPEQLSNTCFKTKNKKRAGGTAPCKGPGLNPHDHPTTTKEKNPARTSVPEYPVQPWAEAAWVNVLQLLYLPRLALPP